MKPDHKLKLLYTHAYNFLSIKIGTDALETKLNHYRYHRVDNIHHEDMTYELGLLRFPPDSLYISIGKGIEAIFDKKKAGDTTYSTIIYGIREKGATKRPPTSSEYMKLHKMDIDQTKINAYLLFPAKIVQSNPI